MREDARLSTLQGNEQAVAQFVDEHREQADEELADKEAPEGKTFASFLVDFELLLYSVMMHFLISIRYFTVFLTC